MNTKIILKSIQEKIALDNFKHETRRKRKIKRTLIAISAVTIIFASLITINRIKEDLN